jgi:hypothetical protein
MEAKAKPKGETMTLDDLYEPDYIGGHERDNELADYYDEEEQFIETGPGLLD